MRLVNTLTDARVEQDLQANTLTSGNLANARLVMIALVIRAKPYPMIILYWLIKITNVITIIRIATDI
jgi:hypothetical protein